MVKAVHPILRPEKQRLLFAGARVPLLPGAQGLTCLADMDEPGPWSQRAKTIACEEAHIRCITQNYSSMSCSCCLYQPILQTMVDTWNSMSGSCWPKDDANASTWPAESSPSRSCVALVPLVRPDHRHGFVLWPHASLPHFWSLHPAGAGVARLREIWGGL